MRELNFVPPLGVQLNDDQVTRISAMLCPLAREIGKICGETPSVRAYNLNVTTSIRGMLRVALDERRDAQIAEIRRIMESQCEAIADIAKISASNIEVLIQSVPSILKEVGVKFTASAQAQPKSGNRPVVLIVEEEDDKLAELVNAFTSEGFAIYATSLGAEHSVALYLWLKEHGVDVDVMVMSVYILHGPQRQSNTVAIQSLRQHGYDGPIIAASTTQSNNDKLLKIGATHTIGGDLPIKATRVKAQAAVIARDILRPSAG